MFELVGKIIGDGASWRESLERAVTDADHATKLIRDAWSRLAQELARLANESLEAWMETEDTLVRLQAVIENQGGDVRALTADYQEFASTIQSITTTGDDAVLALLQQAEAFSLTGDAAKRAVQDAIAIAAINKSSAESMIRITAKMGEGDIKGAMVFSRMIPQLRGVKNELEFVEKYQNLVNGGMLTATRLAETTSGSLAQLKNDWGDLQEEFGKFLAEYIRPLIDRLTDLVRWFNEVNESIGGVIERVRQVETYLNPLGQVGMLRNWIFGGDQGEISESNPLEFPIDLKPINVDEVGKDLAKSFWGNIAAGATGQMLPPSRIPGFDLGSGIADGFPSTLDRSGIGPLGIKVRHGIRVPWRVGQESNPLLGSTFMDQLPSIGGMGGSLVDRAALRGGGIGGFLGGMNMEDVTDTVRPMMNRIESHFRDFFAGEERPAAGSRTFRSNLQEEERQFLALQAGRRGGPEEQTAQSVQRLVQLNEQMLTIQRDQANNGSPLVAANF